MVRETRHLWVGNLPDNIREDRIREHFKRYGRVQNVKLLGKTESANTITGATSGSSGVCATVAFMDIKSASKAHNAEHVLDERTLTTEYYEPAAIPSAAGAPSAGSSPAGSGYSGSSSSVNSTPAPASVSRYHLSGGEESTGNTCPIAATAAAPANWRGTNDSASEYCRRGNTPAAYGRYQRNNPSTPYSTPPSNAERTTPHHRWYAERTGTNSGGAGGATGGESTPSTPGGGTEGGRRRRNSGSGSSRSDSSSPEPSDTSRASTPAAPPPLPHHANHRTPPGHQYQWASTASGRPLAICVRNLPTRSTDTSLKDGLYHEYKKHGKVVWVKVVGQNADRYAVVRFKKPSDVEKALEVSQDKLFFGCKISVAPHQSCDEDADSAKPYETDIDEYHPKATRTLFIGNLEKDVTQQQLRDKFKHFGRIIEVDIKKGSGGGAGYAFCQYASISSVVEAIRKMDGEYVGGSRVKLGFGKPVATTCVWVDGLTEHTEKQEAFYEQLEKHGGSAAPTGTERLSGDITSRYLPSTRHDPLRFDGCGSRSRASSYGRSSSRTPRYPTVDHYDPADYAADRRYRVYDELGSSPQTEEAPYEDRLQSVVVSPHRARRHRRDSSPEDRKHSKERHRSAGGSGGGARRSRSGSRGVERHAGRRRHRRRRDGSGSRGSRAGTPLRDEPDALPSEPRRPPRDRPPLPMSLPLPKFAAQLLRTVPATPRPAPAPALAPDSPPRPPSASSSSAGSAPHSPSLEERIRSLDEKYERWSGSRALADAPDRTRLRHRLLEVDINEVKPSEVVRSLLAKRSVFDEDSERLEGATRAPSPGSSPRRSAACTPRALRYPFPSHPPPPPALPVTPPMPTQGPMPLQQLLENDSDVAERMPDPRLDRLDRVDRLDRLSRPFQAERPGKFGDCDFGRIELRIRPRTPSTDVSQTDSIDRRSPRVDGELEGDSRGVVERRRRDSFLFSGSKSSTESADDKDVGDGSDGNELDTRNEEKNNITLDSKRQNEKNKELSDDNFLNQLLEHNIDKEIDTSVVDQCEENIARDIADMLLKRNKDVKTDSPLERRKKSCDDYNIKSDLPIHNEVRSSMDSDNKLEDKNRHIKNENDKCKDIFTQNHIKKEFVEQDPQNHLITTNLVKSSKEPELGGQEFAKVNDKNGKERYNQNIILDGFHNKKLEKENIEFDKCYEKEKNSNLHFFMEKKPEVDKNDDRLRSDREKLRHSRDRVEKDKHEYDKDKSKNNKTEKQEKDKKTKDENNAEKPHGDKTRLESEKITKEKNDRDHDKNKYVEDKSFKHDHHKKEKSDRDKRKDTIDSEIKIKKEDKHKHDKSRKDSDSKRDVKKESDSIKSRKSSRDESSKDICRKDSTDSSTSRASHDSSKVKDVDNESKEDIKLIGKQFNDIFIKNEEKDLISKCLDTIKRESVVKSKSDIKEDKDEKYHPSKSKNDIALEHSNKPKVDVIEKPRHYSVDSPSVDSKRKERLNSCSSLPSNIGYKRRMSSQDSLDSLLEDVKKSKNDGKTPDRRDSKDSKIVDRHKTTKFNKGHFAKLLESKTKEDKKNHVKPPDHVYDSKDDIKDFKLSSDKAKSSSKKSPKVTNDDKSNLEGSDNGLHNDLDFLATLELRSSEEDEKQKALRKEMKEKKRIQQLQQIQELQMQQDAMHHAELLTKLKDDKKQKLDDKRKEAAREKRMSTDRKSRDDKNDVNKRKNRKQLQSTDSSDSDEPKKHSIFDIIDDGPTYISMYDKVKARSCKNMQKQEEEKRQEKIKAKFSQLKQSRAKREEKKRSSWDEDSDSEHDRKKNQKSSMDSSTDDDNFVKHTKKDEKLHGSSSIDYENTKTNEYFNERIEDDSRNKLSRKNSRSRIMSDTSDDEISSKRSISKSPSFLNEVKKDIISDSDSVPRLKDEIRHLKESSEDKIKKSSLLNLFGKSDSDDSKIKSSIESDYKSSFIKSMSNNYSSESESVASNRNVEIRKKHKRKQKKHKTTFSDDEIKHEMNDCEGEMKLKNADKIRRHSNKKDKRKEKLRESVDTDDTRDDKSRLKKDRKSLNNSFDFVMESISKKEGKMEDIFGPLSDDSDKDTRATPNNKLEYPHDYESFSAEGQLNSVTNSDQTQLKERDEIKRKKDKKRKEKKFFGKEDENSLDVDAVSKAIEARLFAETITDDENRSVMDTLSEIKTNAVHEVKYKNDMNVGALKLGDRHNDKLKKDFREKKKKKKRSKEERQNRKEHHYHHHHHHDKATKSEIVMEKTVLDMSPKTMLLNIPLPNETQPEIDKSDDSKSLSESPSLPRLTESPPVAQKDNILENKDEIHDSSSELSVEIVMVEYVPKNIIEVDEIPMPAPIACDISEVPLPSDPVPITSDQGKRESSFVPSFVDDINTSENAVRSIPNVPDLSLDKIEPPANKSDKKIEEKPRAIISQEETEDAVAALLGESFGGKIDTFSDYEQVENNVSHQNEVESITVENENIPEEDAEEMRQAVQNLNASEMEMKPDTPVSDNDLLLIDTDTEETEETPQDAIERLPINIIATNQSLNKSPERSKSSDIPNIIIAKPKATVVKVLNSEENASPNVKVNETEIKFQLAKRENTQQITSTATPVITSWTLPNNKLLEPHVVNIQPNQLSNRDKIDTKPTHITANIVQIKAPNQGVHVNNSLRPIITPNRVSAPYQVINQMIRPQAPNMQPPTIKIPEPHILYQKPSGIVISPRMTNDPRLQSPKVSPQGEGMTSPRLSNMTILTSSPQNINSVGIAVPTTLQQRSPGQVTVVRMQQPPLSPIQALHLPHGGRTMVSPSRPNSVLVQTQGAPIHFNRLPVTPVLAPISKQMGVNNIVQQNKGIGVTNSPLMHQQKIVTSDIRKSDQRNNSENINENSKIILSPTSLQSSNPTVMAQNRLISMQNAMQIGNINSALHLPNKVLINNINQINEKRENQPPKSDQLNHIPFASTPIIHVAGVNHSTASIIQSGQKPVMCTIHESNNVSRGSNVIHTLSSQRLLTTAPISNVIQIDAATKSTPSVLSMATIRSPTVLTKLETSNSAAVTTTCLTNVVMTPLLLKSSNAPGTIRLNAKNDIDRADGSHLSIKSHITRDIDTKIDEKVNASKSTFTFDTRDRQSDIQKDYQKSINPTPIETATKCETDFEELLRDNTNEIKVTNDPEKKLEVNVGKTVTLISAGNPNQDRKISIDEVKNDITDTSKTIEACDKAVSDHIGNETTTQTEIEVKTQILSEIKTSIDTSSELELQTKSDTSTNSSSPSDISNKTSKEHEKLELSEIENSTTSNDSSFFDLLSKKSEENDNQIKNLDENDSWSAKDVNIDSVIKKVDSLCNENIDVIEMKEDKEIQPELTNSGTAEKLIDMNVQEKIIVSEPHSEPHMENIKDVTVEEFNTSKAAIVSRRGGRSVRGKKYDKNQDRVQTRQISKPARGVSTKRGRGRAKVDKKVKSMVNNIANNMPGDVYDFHEDSGDETATSPNKAETRPRLILTIKSPQPGLSNVTSSLSIQKDQPKFLEKVTKEEKAEDFISPSPNTRKSRRLQEKDVQRSTVDDVIDDVIKNLTKKEANKKRPTRQAGQKTNPEKVPGADTRKSPRGVKRTRDRSLSDASVDSGDERIIQKKEEIPKEAKTPRLVEPIVAPKAETEVVAIVKPIAAVVPTLPAVPAPAPTPIMKPPKKMISEISAKLASAFEAAAAAGPPRAVIVDAEKAPAAELAAVPPALRLDAADELRFARRLQDGVPAMMPVGTEATDARVQSPALPHRPPSSHRPADRATPVLIRGGDGEGMGGVVAPGGLGADAGPLGAGRFRGAYAGPASLPRGAHHPPPPPALHHHPAAAAAAAAAAAQTKQQIAVVGPHIHHHPGTGSRVTLTSVPSISPQGQIGMGEGMYPHFSHQHYQMYQQHFRATQHENRATPSPYSRSLEAEGCEAPTPPLELRRPPSARVPRPAHSPSAPHAPPDRLIMYAVGAGAGCGAGVAGGGRSPPPAHGSLRAGAGPSGPPHASQVPREADSLQMLLRRYPVMWQGLLALKNDSAAVQMHFVGGNPGVAGDTLPRLADGSTPLLRIAQRMRLEPTQLDQVHRKMKMENEHCMLLALPCGRDHMDVLQQSTNLTAGFITYLQRKQAAGIVNVAPPGHQQAMFTVHIFPSCDFANENLNRIAPDLMHRVADIAHLLIVIATV